MASGGPSPLTSLTASRTGTPSEAFAPATVNGESHKTTLCVYCGSSAGNKPIHMETARELARLMAANDMRLGKFLMLVPFLPP